MSDGVASYEDQVRRLRREFDRSFAHAPQIRDENYADLLVIGVGGDRYAVPLAVTSGLVPHCRITPVPALIPEFAGIATFRGNTIPVYGLRRFLGYPAESPDEWMILSKTSPLVGFSFDRFGEYVRAALADIAPYGESESTKPFLRAALRLGDAAVPVLDVSLLMQEITRRIGALGNFKDVRSVEP